MEHVTEADIKQLLETAEDEGLPTGSVVSDDTSITLLVADPAAVQAWADHLGQPVTETDTMVATGYAESGYTFRVVTPA